MPVEHPTDPIGLPDLIITGATETWSRVVLTAERSGDVLCPHCGRDEGLLDPDPWSPVDVADTPIRGRPVTIRLVQWRYRCSPCRKFFIPMPASIQSSRRMTRRLVRYIENLSPRRTKRVIAQEIGVSKDRVDRVIAALAKRLAEHHRFPTPVVLGMDDIKMNKRAYTIFTDAETGRGVGFIEGATTNAIRDFMREHLDLGRVQVVVSDMGLANLAVTKRPGFRHIIHVADQWHVMKGCRKAMSKLVAHQLRKLDGAAKYAAEEREMPAKRNRALMLARQMRALRRQLLGKREYLSVSARTLFDDQALTDLLNRFHKISRAFWARISLASTYSAPDAGTARVRLDQFYAYAAGRSIKATMAKAVATVRDVEPLILNAARARMLLPDVRTAAFSTSSTERRNGKIRAAWRAGRGVTDPAYLRLLALYEPWFFDVDVVECGEPGCNAIEGPVCLIPGLVGQDWDGPVLPLDAHRCRAHRSLQSASVRAA